MWHISYIIPYTWVEAFGELDTGINFVTYSLKFIATQQLFIRKIVGNFHHNIANTSLMECENIM